MKTLQRLLIIALCLLIPSSAMTWGVVGMSGGVASAPAGHATPAIVQHVAADADTNDLALTSSVTAGSLLVAVVSSYASLATVTVEDDVNGPATHWTALDQVTYESTYTRVYYMPNAGSGTTTVSCTGGIDSGWVIFEVSNIETSSPVDNSVGQGQAEVTNVTSGTMTTTHDTDMSIALHADAGNNLTMTWETLDPVWTTIHNLPVATANCCLWVAARVDTSPGTGKAAAGTRGQQASCVATEIVCFKAKAL